MGIHQVAPYAFTPWTEPVSATFCSSQVANSALPGAPSEPATLPVSLRPPYLAVGPVWVCSIEISQLDGRPGSIRLTDDEAPRVKGWWVIGVQHLHAHGGAGHRLPRRLQLALLTIEERLLILHNNKEVVGHLGFIIQRLPR